MKVTIQPGGCRGEVQIPPSKSLAHRAIICAALSQGNSRIDNICYSKDIEATISTLKCLGANIKCYEDYLEIHGGIHLDFDSTNELHAHCNESGSTLRFMIPIFALRQGKTYFTGEGRLLQRPQKVYQEIFTKQQLYYQHQEDKISIAGCLQPGTFEIPGNISSQFISGLLFALPLLNGASVISIQPPFESQSYLHLTIDMLSAFGIRIEKKDTFTLHIPGNQHYQSAHYRVEGDFSQAAFWGVLSAINAPILCRDLNLNSHQGDKAILDILANCGAEIKQTSNGFWIHGKHLTGRDIDLADCPDLGPILMVLALFCQGPTRIYHAKRLRYKESDRIAAMEEELRKLGADISSSQDEIFIQPQPHYHCKEAIETHQDHRIAMAMAVAATKCQNSVTINHGEVVAKSYPNFWEHLKNLGIQVSCND